MEIRGNDIEVGDKIAEGGGVYRIIDSVTPKSGLYVWCEYREYDRDGKLLGHLASRYMFHEKVTKL